MILLAIIYVLVLLASVSVLTLLSSVALLVMLTVIFFGVLTLIWSIMMVECISKVTVENWFNH